ncbi:MAG: hypothetical protein L0241_31155 [Planctomycetia bacterium]|nr:hypothetical protein [Planctomycetia bacterium]
MAKTRTRDRDEDTRDRQKPVARDGAYVMMLFITFVAIVAGTVLMYKDWDEYGKQNPQKEPPIVIEDLGKRKSEAPPPVTPKPPDPEPPPP